MKPGLIRVAALTPDARVADLTYNCDAHIAAAKKAAEDGARILTFPALSLTGACLGDLYFSEALITAAERALARFIKETEGLSLLSAVGLPIAYGGRLYSATAVVYGGSLIGIVPKNDIARGDALSEDRIFSAWDSDTKRISMLGTEVLCGTDLLFTCVSMPALRIAVCPDG